MNTDAQIWASLPTDELEASAAEYEHKIASGAYPTLGFLADIADRIREEIRRRQNTTEENQ